MQAAAKRWNGGNAIRGSARRVTQCVPVKKKKTPSLYIGAWICFAAYAFCSLNWIRRLCLNLHLDWGFSSVLTVGISLELPQRPFYNFLYD